MTRSRCSASRPSRSIESDDPYKRGIQSANFSFEYSYGDPQPVHVLAKRSLGRVTLKYRINGGRVRSADTREWRGGRSTSPPRSTTTRCGAWCAAPIRATR